MPPYLIIDLITFSQLRELLNDSLGDEELLKVSCILTALVR